MSASRYSVAIRGLHAEPGDTRVEYVNAGNPDYAVSRLIEARLLNPKTERVVSVQEIVYIKAGGS